MAEYDDQFDEPDPVREFVQVSSIPADAQRMGFDRNTEEGAMIAMAGSLKPAKLSHKVVAWAVLLIFAGPFIFGLLTEIF